MDRISGLAAVAVDWDNFFFIYHITKELYGEGELRSSKSNAFKTSNCLLCVKINERPIAGAVHEDTLLSLYILIPRKLLGKANLISV